jgi:HD-like signal output (HDOD) protein/nitrogen-specific signal transduction histidine kinase
MISDHDIRNRLLTARLPAMPQILIKLIEHLQADDLGMPELAALISKDAGMTAKILGVANSSAYHRANRVIGLEQSLVALGTDMIKTLVISESVFQTFSNFPHSGSTDLRPFWKASLTAAVVARELARRTDYAHAEEAYLAGLLHNVGRLALLATAPKEYAYNFTARDDEDLCAVELRTLQITHAEAGAWLVERWNLDSFLADSVLYHHELGERLETAHPLVRMVRLAHLVAHHPEDERTIAQAAQLCGVSRDDVAEIAAGAQRQVDKSAAYLGIDLAGADEVPQPPAFAPPPSDPVQQRLSEEVRNLVLVTEAGQSFARQQGETATLEAVLRSARILFNLQSAVVLLENPTGQALVGIPVGEHQRIADFAIPLNKGGVIAQAAQERRPHFMSRNASGLSLAEEQLLRMLDAESLACLPLVAGARCLGVIVGGIGDWQVTELRERERFVQAFAAQAGASLETALSERGYARRQLASAAEEYREASRRVIHEVNNPLSIIKNYLSVLDGKLSRNEPVQGEMSILNEEIDRVGSLVASLAEPHAAAPAARAINVARVADDVIRLFSRTGSVPASVQITAHVEGDAVEVEGDPDMLKQVLMNLVKNAVEALADDGGRIDILNRGHVNRDRRLYLELNVSDNGPGMPTEVLANLFAPVRSTKQGSNRGLGLSIVHSLVTKMNGLVSCRSGRTGTSFEILLPVAAGAPLLPAQPRALDPVKAGNA